ncbi:cytolytic toxin-alpha-like [Pseudorasbora parva]|uniref:cytolytic toxin-alpha-like n=1 Tax=Pseudorasbora parva TaxID=51549 RepID=UPI00351EF738
MAALLMSPKQPSWIYCTCLWLATLAAVNAQEVLKPKPGTTGETKYPALASKPIEVAALGRPLFPGMLYDSRKDTFIPGVTLWDRNSLREDLDTHQQHKTDFDFSSSDSLSSKARLLDVSASLKASFLGGLVEVGGSAKFLRDTKSSNKQSRVTMSYSETTRFDQLTMSHLGKITYPQVFEQKTATHVVTAVLYGAQAFMVFDRRFSEKSEKQKIEGELNVMVKKIPLFSIEGKGAVEMTDEDKQKAEKIACRFYGDVRLEQNPTTYMEALEVFKKLPNILKENPQNAVPIKVWLYPLSLLDPKAAQLEREITTRLVSNTEDIIEKLGDVERTYNDLSRKTMVNVFSDIKERLYLFKNSFNIYQTVLMKAVSRVLPAIRGGEKEEKSLEDILNIHYSSPFKAEMLNQWLDGVKSELDLLSSHTKILEGITTEDSDRLNSILFDPDIDVVVCLTFTSLKYEDPYISTLKEFLKSDKFKELDGKRNMVSVASVRKWFSDPAVISKMRENLSLFRSFSEVNNDEKRYRFIISAISNSSSPGSSIRLYEKGKLTDTQFQPVSKPPPPEVKVVLKRSVSLKLQKSPTGETVQYRVEYRQVNEEQWHVINTPDEVFTLTGLESGRQYLIRYRIVGKVGVSEASDTIGPIPSLGNLALGVTAVHSSTFGNQFVAQQAVDGSRHKCSHTNADLNPWWRGDLREVYKVYRVIITTRADAYATRLNGAQIRIGNNLDNNGNNNELAASVESIPLGETKTFDFSPIMGRFVNIVIPGRSEFLTLCEVEVFGEKYSTPYTCAPRNLALGATAVHSSTHENQFVAQQAVDGSRHKCSHTNADLSPWWRGDLLDVYKITRVIITTRADAYATRLNGAQIRIGNNLDNNGNNNELAATVVSIPPRETKTFQFKPIMGRYVNIVIPGRREFLTLCEVEVYAD